MELQKRYYIGELSRLIGVHPMTLKNWEREGYIPRAHRTDGMIRKRWWTESEAKEIAEYKQTYYRY